jgi:hypothetical protein
MSSTQLFNYPSLHAIKDDFFPLNNKFSVYSWADALNNQYLFSQ